MNDVDRNALLAACQRIGGQLHLHFADPPNSEWFRSKDPVGELARASRISYRQVALVGRWWQADCGPLLGFKKNGSPVALLPVSPAGYQVYDSCQNTAQKATAEWQEELESFAYVFYRPLEAKAIKLKDLLGYAVRTGVIRDIRMLLALGLGGGLLGLAPPVVAGYFFDQVIPLGSRTLFAQLLVILAAAAGSLALLKSAALTVFLRLVTRLEAALQGAVWDRLLHLPAHFFRQFYVDELADRAIHISRIRGILVGPMADTLVSSGFLAVCLAFLLWYHPPIALLALACMMAGLSAVGAIGYWQVKYQKTGRFYQTQASGLRSQWVEALTKLRISGAEGRAFHLWESVFDKKQDADFKSGLLQNGLRAFTTLFTASSYAVVFYTAARDASMTTGRFITVFLALTAFFTVLLHLFNAVPQLLAAVPLYEELKPVLDECPESGQGKTHPGELAGGIRLDQVSFRYAPQGAYALRDFTLEIRSGEYLGITGISGSGKSTLLRLLLGLEKAESGKICYDGVELGHLDILALRRQLGVVLQNSRLIPGDIFYNITGGEARLTMDDAWAAARLAGLAAEIEMLPMGMHTRVSEATKTLSGGQKQRILIARALVRSPKILFFDEATSALDNQAQEAIKDTLAGIRATRIVVAHRFTTLDKCDRIIVLDQGRIVEEGTFADLIRQQGRFAALAHRQTP